MNSSAQSAQRKLHVNGVYKSRKIAANLKADLQALGALDKKSEREIKQRKRIRSGAVTGLTVGIIGTVLLTLTEHAEGLGWLYVPLFLLLVSGGTVAVVATRKIAMLRKDEFPDYRYLSCLGLVTLLEADTASDAILDVSLNLQEQAGTPKKSGGRKPNTYTRRGKVTWKQEEKQEPFLVLRGSLRDGTKFKFTLVEDVNAYGEHYPYRSISGKTKTKLRARKRIRWIGTLSLKFKAKRYAVDPELQSRATSFIQLPPGARAKKILATESHVGMTALTAVQKFKDKRKETKDIAGAWKSMAVDETATSIMLSHFSAMMFLSLYQLLNASIPEKTQS
ncbi:MAG: hypothetical protein ACI9R3_005630 [Verrucomicrobiales bacterium]|jgi:hypothetical protein